MLTTVACLVIICTWVLQVNLSKLNLQERVLLTEISSENLFQLRLQKKSNYKQVQCLLDQAL